MRQKIKNMYYKEVDKNRYWQVLEKLLRSADSLVGRIGAVGRRAVPAVDGVPVVVAVAPRQRVPEGVSEIVQRPRENHVVVGGQEKGHDDRGQTSSCSSSKRIYGYELFI